MNKSQYFELLQKINSLSAYAELIPEGFSEKYLSQIADIKSYLNNLNTEIKAPITTSTQEVAFAPAPTIAPPPPPPQIPVKAPPPPPPKNLSFLNTTSTSLMSFRQAIEESKVEASIKEPIAKVEQKSNFETVLSSLIAHISDEGKKVINDLDLPIKFYKTLKLLEDKLALNDLIKLHGHNYKNIFTLLHTLYELEDQKYIYFAKSQNIKGWIKFGELVSEGKLTGANVVSTALLKQKTSRGKLLGDILLEMDIFDETIQKQLVKVQRWISRLLENSILVKKSAESNTSLSAIGISVESKSMLNVLNFIIPEFNAKGKEILANPDKKDLASKISLIDGKSSLLEIFTKYSDSFANNKLNFLKFIFKLESQDILNYQNNKQVKEHSVSIKLGELLLNLDLVSVDKLEEALNARLMYENLKNLYIGEVLVSLKYLDNTILEECIKIQKWCNIVLQKISYENAFVLSIRDVLKNSFSCPVEVGTFRKMAFANPLNNMVCIVFPISGKINGSVYYIMDNSFMDQLSEKLLASYGMESQSLNESLVTEISNIITGTSLTYLSNMGLFCETNIPSINIGNDIIVANKKTISVIPLTNDWGRFAVGLEIN